MNELMELEMTNEEFKTILRGIRFALTHSETVEEAIQNFDQITGNIAKEKEPADTPPKK